MAHLQIGDVFIRHRTMAVNVEKGPAPVGEYVVEEAEMNGGGAGHGSHDAYPDGWRITARKLAADGGYDPAGKVIRFYQSGCFTIVHNDVPVVRQMKRTFV